MSRLRLGIVGIGAAQQELAAAQRHPRIDLAAVADIDPGLLASTVETLGIAGFASAQELCESALVDAVYIGTPTPLHVEHALLAIAAGKHLIVAKPMALQLADAMRIVEAAERAGVQMMVGHTQSYEPAIVAMGKLIRSGDVGPVRLISSSYYTDWIYRGRKPEELDTRQGGGVVYRQAAHQFDIIRLLSGGLVRSVRAITGVWDASRPAEGAYSAFLDLGGGAALATFSGYDHLHSTDIGFPIGEGGRRIKERAYGEARMAITHSRGSELELKRRRRFSPDRAAERHHSFYGLTIVSCERGDIRQSPSGLLVYGDAGISEITVPSERTGRDLMLDELCAAVLDERPPLHSGRWGMATLEAQLAVLRSGAENREIALSHQVAVR